MAGKVMAMIKGKAAIVPRPELPWLVEPEEQTAMMVPMAEVMMLEMRHMAEPEPEVAIVELEHETALAEVTEVPRLEVPMLPEETVVVKLEATMRPMELCASVWGEMAEAHAALARRGRLPCQRQRAQNCCKYHDPAHRPAP